MLTLVSVAIIVFFLFELSPINPIDAYIGAEAISVSPEQRANIAAKWGLNQPAGMRFLAWFSNIARGDFGMSMIYEAPVLEVIMARFRQSMLLMVLAWLLIGTAGFSLGIIAGLKQGTWIDRLIKGYCVVVQSIPAFWLGLLLMLLFAVRLGWLPLALNMPAGQLNSSVTLADRLTHAILPALTLSLVGIADLVLYIRAQVLQILGSEYILFAKARGETPAELVGRHIMRNAAIPAITISFNSFAQLLGGVILIEQVFSYPGLGKITVEAGLRGDLPLLLGISLFSVVFVFVGNTMADFFYRVVDPRLKEASDF